jgi:hypothetical protein
MILGDGNLQRLLGKELCFFKILEQIGTLIDNESWQ